MNESRTIKKIAVDGRSLLLKVITSRGIGHYVTNFLKTLAKTYSDLQITLYFEKGSDITSVKEKFCENNFIFDFYELNKKISGELFLIPDPMTIYMGFDSPFRFVSNDIPVSIIFYDFNPIIYKEYFDKWDKNEQGFYLERLEQIKEIQPQILAISEYTKSDVIKYLDYKDEKVTPILAGLNESHKLQEHSKEEIENTLRKYHIEPPFFLTVGSCETHKNFEFSVSSILSLQGEYYLKFNSNVPKLVVVGDIKDPYKMSCKELLDQKGIKDIIFTDYVSQKELGCLYSAATALLFPSSAEGFGFPVLEAMANKCAVITCPKTSIPEIAGPCALYVEPNDEKSMVSIMQKLLDDDNYRKNIIEKGFRRSELFSWEKSVRKAMSGWEKLQADKQHSTDKEIQNIQIKNEIKNVAIDARFFSYQEIPFSTNGKYGIYLINSLANKYPNINFELLIERKTDRSILEKIFPQIKINYLTLDKRCEADLLFIPAPLFIKSTYDSPFRLFSNIPTSTLITDLSALKYREMILNNFSAENRLSFSSRIDQLKDSVKQILVPSNYLKEEVINYLSFQEEQIFKVEVGNCLNPNQHITNKEEILRSLKITRPYFLWTGNCLPYKNFEPTLIAYLNYVEVCKNNNLTIPQFVITGNIYEPYKLHYLKYITDNKLQDNIIFTHIIPNEYMGMVYQSAEALLLPSDNEEVGLSILEAILNGCPVIATNRGSIPEFSNNCAIYIDPNNTPEYVKTLYNVSNDKNLREELKNKSNTVSKLFSWDIVAQKVYEAWNKIYLSN